MLLAGTMLTRTCSICARHSIAVRGLHCAAEIFGRSNSRMTLVEAHMNWETPGFIELAMNAEIGSYQDDFGGGNDPVGESENQGGTD
jgi:hypothetical protein